MNRVGWYLLAGLVVFGGCGSDSHGPDDDLSALSPEELCAEKCALQVSAGCSNTPPDYQQSCTAICAAKYASFPSCAADLRPLDVCAIQRVRYGCTASGTVTAAPMGACGSEGLRCAECTGDVLACL